MGRRGEATTLTQVINDVTNILIDGTRLYRDIKSCGASHSQMDRVIKETGGHGSEKREGIKIRVDCIA